MVAEVTKHTVTWVMGTMGYATGLRYRRMWFSLHGYEVKQVAVTKPEQIRV